MSVELTLEEQRQGTVVFELVGNWNLWVKRRVEQITLVTDSRVERRIGVDFRLHPEIFGTPTLFWGDEPIHYVPLTLLKKAPFMNFDLRDETGAAIPLLTRRKTATIGTATLCAAAKNFVQQRFLEAKDDSLTENASRFRKAIAEGQMPAEDILLPPRLQDYFSELCRLPFKREDYETEHPSASGVWEEMIQHAVLSFRAADMEKSDVTDWVWMQDGNNRWSAPDQDENSWLRVLLSDKIFSGLTFDFQRLFMVFAPVSYEKGRRRLLKIQYEEHLVDPGLKEFEQVRKAMPRLAKHIRRSEDRAEGLKTDPAKAQREWIISESASNREGSRPSIYKKLKRGIGWLGKPLTFDLPGLGFGGSFHLEFSAPEGIQIRRGRLRAKRVTPPTPGLRPREEFARRYARNVSRCHLYLGRLLPGASGEAMVAIKPGSTTIVRGAALSSILTTILIACIFFFADRDITRATSTVVALLLLAPGLIAAQLARPNEHPVTTGMLFGLRMLALAVAGVAVIAAALLGAQQTPDHACVPWAIVLGAAVALTLVLLRSWRLAGRDWPMRDSFE